MSTEHKDKEKENTVNQNAIHIETIKKELRCQKLFTTFTINPFKKLHVLPDKPMTRKIYEEAVEDSAFLQAIHGAHSDLTKKYSHPITEAQEIGWISTPLLESDRSDRRLNFPRTNTEITKYMEAAWRMKEQTQNLK